MIISKNQTTHFLIEQKFRQYDNNNKRYFDFTEFKDLGSEFVNAFAKCFVKYSSTVGGYTSAGAYGSALHFLRWLMNNRKNLGELSHSLLNDYKDASSKDWEYAVELWQQNLLKGIRPGLVRKKNIISSLHRILRNLITFGVIPNIYIPLVPKYLSYKGRPTKSLAEASRNKVLDTSEDILSNAFKSATGSDVDIQIKKDFLTTLLQEKGTIAGTAIEHAKELMKINVE